jgi:hypothetical protein
MEELKGCGFTRVGEMKLCGDFPVPRLNAPCEWSGGVYAWVAEGSPSEEILYIGKAGSTLARRCSQHRNGFNGKSRSKAGLRNGAKIKGVLEEGGTVGIWARQSDRIELFGQSVSMCSIEEEALIAKFRPSLNTTVGP